MNHYDEQALRDEVIYLHSLWHQGPPRKPDSRLNPNNTTNEPSRDLHIPAKPTPFKKTKAKKKKAKKVKATNKCTSGSNPSPDPGPEWPVKEIQSPPATTGWPKLKPWSAQVARTEPLSAEEQAKVLAMRVQHKALESACEFFSDRMDQESDEDDEEMELGDEDYLMENDGQVEREEYNFFLELFIQDDKLRGYYETNHESGDFCCLVCRGIGEKINKRYKGCLGLVQHARSISKTKGKRAHRAFGDVVCKVLGWDIDRLPVIVLKGEPLGRSLASADATQTVVANGNATSNQEPMTVIDGSMIQNNGERDEKDVSHVTHNDDEIILREGASAKGNSSGNETFVEGSNIGNNGKTDGKEVSSVNHNDRESELCEGDLAKRNGTTCQENLTISKDNKDTIEGNKAEMVEKVMSGVNQNNGEVTISENFLKEVEVNNCDKSPGNGLSNVLADKVVAVDGRSAEGPSLVSGIKWPYINPVDESSTMTPGWPILKPRTPLLIGLISVEEQVRLAAMRLQHQVSEACREFFDDSASSDGDEADSEDEDDYMDKDGLEDSEEFKFLLKMFMEKKELRDYYQKYNGDGEFYCLVCRGIGKKGWKRFKDCLGLLQHSTAIAKTKKKRAHRAFAQVICKVLGWDINSLPAIVLKGEPFLCAMEPSDMTKVYASDQGGPNEPQNNIHG